MMSCVKTVNGANCSDMQYCMKPIMTRSPNHIVLHLDTDSLNEDRVENTAKKNKKTC